MQELFSRKFYADLTEVCFEINIGKVYLICKIAIRYGETGGRGSTGYFSFNYKIEPSDNAPLNSQEVFLQQAYDNVSTVPEEK